MNKVSERMRTLCLSKHSDNCKQCYRDAELVERLVVVVYSAIDDAKEVGDGCYEISGGVFIELVDALVAIQGKGVGNEQSK